MEITNLRKSKVEEQNQLLPVTFLLVNSLREERLYIHYFRGALGTQNSQCGIQQHKMRKAGRSWQLTDEICPITNAPIYRIM